MSFTYIQARYLVCLVGRNKGDALMRVAKNAGARGGTICFGRTESDNPILKALALADVEQDILITLLGDESDSVMCAIKQAAIEHPKKFSGYALTVPIPRMRIRLCAPEGDPQEQTAIQTPQDHSANRRAPMESGYELITVITNSGYADDVMAAARKAGATGGTIMTAHGTGTEEDVKFFGITLVPEKEMLIMVSRAETVQPILDAIATVPKLNEPGGGIVYTMKVEEFMVLGK